jgi:hypothetical protein
MHLWELAPDSPLDRVLEWCIHEKGVDRLLLSARLDQDKEEEVLLNPSIDQVVARVFGERVLERRLARSWPGTVLIGHFGVVYVIDFDLSLIVPMIELGPLLSDWRHWREDKKPRLPEDPCLYKLGDDWPVLVSVTHEGDAWIVSENRPPFCHEESDLALEDLDIPKAESFVDR